MRALRAFCVAFVFWIMAQVASAMDSRTAIWIDTDAGCGLEPLVDVDDCWALILALTAPEFDLRGISTVHGNVAEAHVYRTVTTMAERFHPEAVGRIHRGAAAPWLGSWRDLFGLAGFYPFDGLAVVYGLLPALYRCRDFPAKVVFNRSIFVNRDELEVGSALATAGRLVRYCHGAEPALGAEVLSRLMSLR